MKAIVYREYGSPDVLKMETVDTPTPKENEVLIRVHAATVNRTDCAMLRAKPFIMRFMTGLFKPRNPVLGTDFAGKIASVGPGVTSFCIGDRVFVFDDNGLSSHAEYLVLSENKAISVMPENMSYEQAAASIEGAHYAYNFINKIKLEVGQRVLVNGATGAIGSAAVQLLKFLGAEVDAVCSTENIDLVKAMGVDNVIDYTKEDFTQSQQDYDYVFDAVGKSTFSRCKPLLKSGGIYISSELGFMAQNLFLSLVPPLPGIKKVKFPIPVDIKRSLHFVKSLIDQGHFNALMDRTYPMDQIADAFRYVEKGQKTGNVTIKMDVSKV